MVEEATLLLVVKKGFNKPYKYQLSSFNKDFNCKREVEKGKNLKKKKKK